LAALYRICAALMMDRTNVVGGIDCPVHVGRVFHQMRSGDPG
jgi:hypothetical protein